MFCNYIENDVRIDFVMLWLWVFINFLKLSTLTVRKDRG